MKKVNENEAYLEELLRLESMYCSWGDTVHYCDVPKLFVSCEGCFLFDEKGIPYLDLQMWYSAASFGYKNPRLNKSLKEQLEKLPQLACQYVHPERIEVSTMISQLIEKRFGLKGRVHLNVSGTLAIEDSLKLVRNKTGKNLVFAFMGGYHGRSLAASAITSSYRYRRRYGHFSDRACFVPFPYCFRCFYKKRKEDCDLFCISQFERLFESEYYSVWDEKAKSPEFCAFYIEPVQGTGGYIIPPKGYFERLQKILKERGILLVDDEIQMGFYRTGKLWAIENFNTVPDIIVFGKTLTNGLNPLSGLWAREELINPSVFPPGSAHSTFSANPLGTAVAKETLKMISEKDYESMIKHKGEYFLSGLYELQRHYPHIIGDVDGIGMAFRIEICHSDGYTPNRELTHRIFEEGLKGNLQKGNKRYGLILDIGGYYKNVFTLSPALTISQEEINLALELLDQLFSRFA